MTAPRTAEVATGRQAAELRRLVREHSAARAASRRVVAVVGAKGGVGASTVTLSLASALAQLGQDAVAVEARPMRPDLTLLAAEGGAAPAPSPAPLLGGAAAGTRPKTVRALGATIARAFGGGVPDTRDGASLASQVVVRSLGAAPPGAWILLDAGDALSDWAVELVRAAGRALLVTTPHRVPLLHAFAAAKHLRRAAPSSGVALALNLVQDQHEAERIRAVLDSAAREAGTPPAPLAGWLAASQGGVALPDASPIAAALMAAVMAAQPLAPRSAA